MRPVGHLFLIFNFAKSIEAALMWACSLRDISSSGTWAGESSTASLTGNASVLKEL